MQKQITNFFTTDNKFFTYVLVIIGIYVAQTLFKISKCRKDGTFDWKLLINGLIDYAIYFCGVIVVQAIKCFKNIKETFDVKDTDVVVNDKNAYFGEQG